MESMRADVRGPIEPPPEGRGEGGAAETLVGRWTRCAREYARRPAVCADAGEWTYEQLDEISDRVAGAILARGGASGRAVALLMGHDGPAIAAMLGALKAGRAYVCLKPDDPAARLGAIVGQSGADTLIADGPNLELARRLTGSGTLCVSFEEAAQARRVEAGELPGVTEQTTACIHFTSGSTGQARAVPLNHRHLLRNNLHYTNAVRIGPEDRMALVSPLSFAASSSAIYGALCNGASLCLFDAAAEGPERLGAWLAEQRLTLFHAVPTLYRAMLAPGIPGSSAPGVSGTSGGGGFAALRVVRLAGEAVRMSDFELFKRHFGPACRFMVVYATTETGLIAMWTLERDAEVAGPVLPVGRGLADVEVKLLDEAGKEVERGEVGRIAVRGKHLAEGQGPRAKGQGESQEPGAISQKGGSDGKPKTTEPGVQSQESEVRSQESGGGTPRLAGDMYEPGDWGRFREDGLLEHLGRADQQVKIRGNRVELGEVEAALLRLEGIAQAAVMAHSTEEGEVRLVAYVSERAGARGSIQGWRRALREMLPGYMMPWKFVVLESLPTNSSGKVDRQSLPPPEVSNAPQGEADGRERVGLSPRDYLEKRLAAIWESVLQVRPVYADDDFFDLGGHSLQAAAIVSRVQIEFGQSLPASLLFQAGTVERQAAVLAGKLIPGDSALVPIQPKGAKRPLFCCHGAQGEVFLFSHLAQRLGMDQPLYGLQAPGLLGEWPLMTLEAIARHRVGMIEKVDPRGPYLLAGHCVGGIVALEIARQLQAKGKRVAALVLIGTPYPGKSPLSRAYGWRTRIPDAVRDIGRVLRWRALLAGDRLRGRGRERRFSPAYRRFVGNMNSRAILSYRVRPYQGATLALTTHKNVSLPAHDPAAQLLARISPPPTHLRVPGEHVSCMEPPHVDTLAQRVREFIEARTAEEK